MGKVIQIEVPDGLEEKFITKFEEIIRKLELIVFSEILKEMVVKSELSKDDAEIVSKEIKREIMKRYESYLGY